MFQYGIQRDDNGRIDWERPVFCDDGGPMKYATISRDPFARQDISNGTPKQPARRPSPAPRHRLSRRDEFEALG
jgi:hypothetical protein